MAGLIVQAPVAPDFHLCHSYYENRNPHRDILWNDCIQAEAKMPRSDSPITWTHHAGALGDDPPELELEYSWIYRE